MIVGSCCWRWILGTLQQQPALWRNYDACLAHSADDTWDSARAVERPSLQYQHPKCLCLTDGRVVASLVRNLGTNCCLENLTLSKNSIGDRGALAVARQVGRAHVLKYLDLSDNGIGDDGASFLAKLLPIRSTKSFALSLRGNQLGETGATALLETRSLHKLDISRNAIDLQIERPADRAGWFENALKRSTICCIDLSHNALGPSVAVAVSDVLQRNANTFESMYLNATAMNRDGVKSIADAMHFNDTMQDLSLMGCVANHEDQHFLATIHDSCASNRLRRKAVKALTSTHRAWPQQLPLAVVPRVLQIVEDVSVTEDKRRGLSKCLLYSTLRSQPTTSPMWIALQRSLVTPSCIRDEQTETNQYLQPNAEDIDEQEKTIAKQRSSEDGVAHGNSSRICCGHGCWFRWWNKTN